MLANHGKTNNGGFEEIRVKFDEHRLEPIKFSLNRAIGRGERTPTVRTPNEGLLGGIINAQAVTAERHGTGLDVCRGDLSIPPTKRAEVNSAGEAEIATGVSEINLGGDGEVG